MEHERTKPKLAAHLANETGRRLAELKLTAVTGCKERQEKMTFMAAATQSAPIQGLGTERRSCVSRQFPEAQRQNIAGQVAEATLVLAAQNGDAHAFEILIERYQRRILAVARRFTRNREDTEDIVQQSFQKAFIQLHKFEGRSCFSTWLTRIAINEALMLLRRGRGRREVSINDLSGNEETALGLEIPDSRADPEINYLQGERSRILSAAMNRLTPRIRKAIELRELGELSTEEAARVMGVSVGAVKARVFHGRRKLRKLLKRESAWVSGIQILQAAARRMASRGINSSAVPVIRASTR
jgi:RNA polymerase sigma-70 factor (ECF subfamily)